MPYDEELAARMREILDDRAGITEKKMFGGVAFLVGGNMAISASGQGGALVRVDPAATTDIVATTSAEVAVMQGRAMLGWLRVPAEDLRTRRQLAAWVVRGTDYAGSLPVKGGPEPAG